jgi:hypothetical protein
MTAVVGILNKQGIAIAADSAVTVSGTNNRKVYNSANKIFTLSKYCPVSVAIYNNAQFMGIPWEILIKEYRKQLRKNSFNTLSEYKDDFFNWLKKNKYFINQEDAGNNAFNDFMAFIQAVLNDAHKKYQDFKNNFQDNLIDFLENYVKNEIPRHAKVDSLKDTDENYLKKILEKRLPEAVNIMKKSLKVDFNDDLVTEKLISAYYQFIIHDQFLSFSGLIFSGYGEKELFPQLIPVNVSIVFNNQLRFMTDDSKVAAITNQNSACIRPFAQTDVIDTILQGISPELNNLSAKVFGDFIHEFLKEIKALKDMPEQVLNKLNVLNVKKYIQEYKSNFGNIISQKYVSPLMGAVSQLSKEDLAEMAESLVYLTYLKRRFTMAEESVGGPVDIAVITKGDGFVWIKRKHYFDPQLNPGFFNKNL